MEKSAPDRPATIVLVAVAALLSIGLLRSILGSAPSARGVAVQFSETAPTAEPLFPGLSTP